MRSRDSGKLLSRYMYLTLPEVLRAINPAPFLLPFTCIVGQNNASRVLTKATEISDVITTLTSVFNRLEMITDALAIPTIVDVSGLGQTFTGHGNLHAGLGTGGTILCSVFSVVENAER
jgi:hypothetical protein